MKQQPDAKAKKWSRSFKNNKKALQRKLLQQRARDLLVAVLQQEPEAHWLALSVYGGDRWEVAVRGIENETLYAFDLDLKWYVYNEE